MQHNSNKTKAKNKNEEMGKGLRITTLEISYSNKYIKNEKINQERDEGLQRLKSNL